jgi:hypothetical protein
MKTKTAIAIRHVGTFHVLLPDGSTVSGECSIVNSAVDVAVLVLMVGGARATVRVFRTHPTEVWLTPVAISVDAGIRLGRALPQFMRLAKAVERAIRESPGPSR